MRPLFSTIFVDQIRWTSHAAGAIMLAGELRSSEGR